MCRIAGMLNFSGRVVAGSTLLPRELLLKMVNAMAYGGPDGEGVYWNEQYSVGMAHRRLAIFDTSPSGVQPMCASDGEIWISFNGAIYNYKELRDELCRNGIVFSTKTDTEVLLKAYQRWGVDAFSRLNGMFAFSIIDVRRKRVFLCRDRVGIKPLYFYRDNNCILWASELKAMYEHPGFSKCLSKEALVEYLHYGYINAPLSIFENTHKVKPGTYLDISFDGQITECVYWDIDAITRRYSLDDLGGLLEDSVRLRLRADVPVGIFLSGGIDSSLVAALASRVASQRVKTFTVGFESDQFDESRWAQSIARHLDTDHTEHIFTKGDLLDGIAKFPVMYDEPFANRSGLAVNLLSQMTKKAVSVALAADGGDELFAGYDRYYAFKDRVVEINKFFSASYKRIPAQLWNKIALSIRRKRKLFSGVSKFPPVCHSLLCGNDFERLYRYSQMYFLPEDVLLLSRDLQCSWEIGEKGFEHMSQLLKLDLKTYLPGDGLTKVDRASMFTALEVREPFLDHRIVELAVSNAPLLSSSKSDAKKSLKDILATYVPVRFWDRPKKGFGVPIHLWFRDSLREMFYDYLSPERIRRGGLFDPAVIRNLLDDFFIRGKDQCAYRLWFLLNFEMWRECWDV